MGSNPIKACENDITTVTEKWVEDLWEISIKLLRPIVPERSEDFKRITEANKCPVFHGATICASNVSADEKAKLARLIDDNGGTYSAQEQFRFLIRQPMRRQKVRIIFGTYKSSIKIDVHIW